MSARLLEGVVASLSRVTQHDFFDGIRDQRQQVAWIRASDLARADLRPDIRGPASQRRARERRRAQALRGWSRRAFIARLIMSVCAGGRATCWAGSLRRARVPGAGENRAGSRPSLLLE